MNSKLTMPNPVQAKEYFEDKMCFTTGPVELERMIKQHENINVIDVREEEDYRKGHVPGAINLPREKWGTIEGLSKDRTNVLYCYNPVCHLAAAAGLEFASKGFPVMEMEGGFKAWQDMDLEIEKPHASRMFAFRH